jgi:hypothetical protein
MNRSNRCAISVEQSALAIEASRALLCQCDQLARELDRLAAIRYAIGDVEERASERAFIRPISNSETTGAGVACQFEIEIISPASSRSR